MDCIEFLEGLDDKSVDLVLTDPPYEVSRKTTFVDGGMDRFHVKTEFGEWDYGFDLMGDVAVQAYRVLRKGGQIISFCDLWKIGEFKDDFEAAGLKQIRFIEWLKTNAVPMNSHVNYLTSAREAAVTAVKGGKPTFHSVYDKGIYEHSICNDPGRFHPTQKPVALMEELILKHSSEGDLVVDCFAGSATTAVACARTGRRFAGCELSSEYFEKSVERLESLGIEVTTSLEAG